MSEIKTIVNKRDVRKSYIAIKPLPLETVTKSGLLVDFMRSGERNRGDQPVMGVVVSTPEVFKNDLPVGAKVVYSDLNGGYWAELDGQTYFFTYPSNIHMVVGFETNVEIPIFGVMK